jgi:hypothetical protein
MSLPVTTEATTANPDSLPGDFTPEALEGKFLEGGASQITTSVNSGQLQSNFGVRSGFNYTDGGNNLNLGGDMDYISP